MSPTKPKGGTLGMFEGRPVLGTTVKITNTGDGLSQAMNVDSVELHHEETIYVVLECVVVDVQTPMVKNTDGVQRKHVLRAGRATLMDKKAVESALDEQTVRIEEAKGINRLPFGDDEATQELRADHVLGKHQKLNDACPLCNDEKQAAADEKKSPAAPKRPARKRTAPSK